MKRQSRLSEKNTKKLINFNNLELIDKLVKDEAKKTGKTESSIIESCIIDYFLPQNDNGRVWVEEILYSSNTQNNIGKTLCCCFGYLGTNMNGKARYNNTYAIVDFAKRLSCLSNVIITGDEPQFKNLCYTLERLIENVSELAKRKKDDYEKFKLEQHAKYMNDLLKQDINLPQSVVFASHYAIVTAYWDIFKEWFLTYQFLSDLAYLQTDWQNTVENRTELLKILCNVTNEWKD